MLRRALAFAAGNLEQTAMSMTETFRSLGRVLFGLVLLLTVGVLGPAGCKSDKPPIPDMAMSMPDLSGAVGCEAMKCQNPDAQCCNGEPCVDTTANASHCGGCGKACRPREVCSDSSCTCMVAGKGQACALSETCCSDGCHETMSDVLNCGGCNLACKMGEACAMGKCACGDGGKSCHGSEICCAANAGDAGNPAVCADLQSDPKNCGKCGHQCAAGKACNNGLCDGECAPCAMGETCCMEDFGDAGTAAMCANLFTDNNNCGKCGKKCPTVLGIMLPCILGICAFSKNDGGMDDGGMSMSDMDSAVDLSVPHD
jgi:hypothetical protein